MANQFIVGNVYHAPCLYVGDGYFMEVLSRTENTLIVSMDGDEPEEKIIVIDNGLEMVLCWDYHGSKCYFQPEERL